MAMIGMLCMVMKVMVMMVNIKTSILTCLDTLPWQAGPNCGRASPSEDDYIEHTNTEDDYIEQRNTEDDDVHDEDDEQEQLRC